MLLSDFFDTLAFAGVMALIAVVYAHILLREPVLHWWLKIGERYERRWFFKPVWGCHKCMAGQLALWLYLLRLVPYDFKLLIYLPGSGHYSFIGHIFAIYASIFISEILATFYNNKLS